MDRNHSQSNNDWFYTIGAASSICIFIGPLAAFVLAGLPWAVGTFVVFLFLSMACAAGI